MVRRRSLIVQLALVGALGLLIFPGASSALLPQYVVTLAPTGPSPTVMTVPAGYSVLFRNTDSVTHSVAFANGSCSIDVAPGTSAQCSGFAAYVGDYDYTVDGTSKAQLVFEAIPRSVSLTAKHTRIHRGSQVTLHGRLQDIQYHSPPNPGSPQPIIVIARPYAGHPFHRVAVVMATVHTPKGAPPAFGELLWQVRIRPRSSMTYVAIASYQPTGGRVWERARSKPLRVNVRR